jgi:thioredoxin-related protein
MKKFFYFLLFIPILSKGQTAGIQFVSISWDSVRAQAKSEHKYIFVDYYATWCGPCKQMDNEVYPDPEVGSQMNKAFISVKMQMDTSRADDAATKARYADAAAMMHTYPVRALPTFLFFSPDGKLVRDAMGYRNKRDFLVLIQEALHIDSQYSVLLRAYHEGTLPLPLYPRLAVYARDGGNDKLTEEVAANYKTRYLDKASDDELGRADNLQFILKFPNLISGTGDIYFRYFLKHPEIPVGSANGQATPARIFVDYMIGKEEIDDKIYDNGKIINPAPDWQKIAQTIKHKYAKSYADELIIPAQLRFYQAAGQWRSFAKMVNKLIGEYPPKAKGHDFEMRTQLGEPIYYDFWALNMAAWNTFLKVSDREVLANALQWVNLALMINKPGLSQIYDTKANILYKLGSKREAIEWENKAIDFDDSDGDAASVTSYIPTIKKMEAGLPTWSVK